MKYILIFALSLTMLQCTDRLEEPTNVLTGPFESVLISNYTGHLIRRGGVLCGEGINVEFEITTTNGTDRYFYEPDTYRSVPVKVERGDVIRIKAFEPGGEGVRNLLASTTATFDPPTESWIESNPQIILCPKNVISVFDFE